MHRRSGEAAQTPEPSRLFTCLGEPTGGPTLRFTSPLRQTSEKGSSARSRAGGPSVGPSVGWSVGVVGSRHAFSTGEQPGKLGWIVDEDGEVLRTDPKVRPLIFERDQGYLFRRSLTDDATGFLVGHGMGFPNDV